MTNETAAAGMSLAELFRAELAQQAIFGSGFRDQAVNWLTDKGLSLAASSVSALLILLFGWLAIRLVVALIDKAFEKRGTRNSLFGNFVRNATSKACWIVLLIIVLEKLGVDVAPLIAGLGVSGFILGFAFQESLGNLASGLMIALNEPFKIGDYAVIAGHEGKVLKMDMMATTLATADNKKIVIPNKSAWGSPIVNFYALGRRRVDIKIGIDYSCDVAKAIRIALETVPTVAGVLPEPTPSVFVASLDDSQVTLNIRPWAEGSSYWNVYNDTQVALKSAFEKNGIAIPFPQLTVHLDRQETSLI